MPNQRLLRGAKTDCGWPEIVTDIYERAKKDIDDALDDATNESNDWNRPEKPLDGEMALKYGPGHLVWADENWDCVQSCLKYAEDPRYKTWYQPALEIVCRSLRELAALPLEQDDAAALIRAEHLVPRGEALERILQQFPAPQEWWDEDE